MAFITATEIRTSNDKLKEITDITDEQIESRRDDADDVIFTDLSQLLTEAEITALTGAKTLYLLSMYKSNELILVKFFGAARNVDVITDIQYWQKMYNDLLKKILKGLVTITLDDEGYVPLKVPVISEVTSPNNAKFYPQKGVEGIVPPGGVTDIVVDKYKG